MLPGVLPGVTWSVTWCYLGVAWLPGFFLFIFCGPKITAFLKLELFEKSNFHLKMLPGPTPVVVTCLPGPPSDMRMGHVENFGYIVLGLFGVIRDAVECAVSSCIMSCMR